MLFALWLLYINEFPKNYRNSSSVSSIVHRTIVPVNRCFKGFPGFGGHIHMLEYGLLRNLILILIALIAPAAAYSAPGDDRPSDTNDVHRLRLYHTHTDEHIDVVYRVGEEYVPEAIDELEHFLRDHRTGTVVV